MAGVPHYIFGPKNYLIYFSINPLSEQWMISSEYLCSGCNIRSQRHTGRREKLIHKIILSPQCAIFGDSHISDKDEVVLEVVFSVEHATALFNDTDAYGTVFANPKAIEGLLQIKNAPRNVAVEDWNWIAYYTGKTTIFSIDTEIGVVSARTFSNSQRRDSIKYWVGEKSAD